MIHSARTARSALSAPELRAILFDLDGTLVDSIGIVFNAIAKMVRKHGFEPDFEAIRMSIGQPINPTLSSFIPADKIPAIAADYTEYYNTVAVKETRLFPGVIEGLESLSSDYLLGIVTGKYEEGAKISLKESKIFDYFQVIVGGDTAERGKPYPDPVLYALDKLGVKAEEALFVGDSVHDIHAGKSAGVKSVAILGGVGRREEFEEIGTEEIFENIQEFFASLK